MEAEGQDGPSECRVKVFCRIRPLNKLEERNEDKFLPQFPSDVSIRLGEKVYSFDRVFKPNSTQEQVYKAAAYHIVQDVLSGYNGSILAYGQSSSGKTQTMEGVIGDANLQGIIPRIVQDVFNHIFNLDQDLQFHIKVSFFEIYNEKIRDLLDPEKMNLSIHEDKNRVPYVEGATERFVGSPDELLACIEEGKSNRQVAVTNMNEHSSRSHSVFLITVNQENTVTKKQLSGKLYLVDLAGSEKVSKTGAQGTVLEEAKNINKSLTALGIVISALAEGTKSHVPYRDSKLTRILQESLGGNSQTTVIICASPARSNEAETKSTLDFGRRAKTIKNVVQVNEELTAEEWKRRYEKEKEKNQRLHAAFQGALLELSRWRAGDRVPEGEWVAMSESMASTATSGDVSKPSMERSMIAPAPPLLTSASTPITDAEKKAYEEERAKIYQQLDEKDDEIQRISQDLDAQRSQVVLLEEGIETMKRNEEIIREENLRIQREVDEKANESKEMISALEEITARLDQKTAELEKVKQEIEILNEENQGLDDRRNQAESQLNSHLMECGPKIKHFKETIYSIVKDYNLGEIAAPNEHLPDHELLNHIRIGVSKMFSENTAAKEEVPAVPAPAAQDGQEDRTKQAAVRETNIKELKPLTDRVNMELNKLRNLKKELMRVILSKCQPSQEEDECLSCPAQRQRVIFLENNLDKLTKVHKQLVRDNAELRVELPKWESRLRSREERIKQLEGALRETKERSQMERRKYQQEVERIKEAVRLRNLRRQHTPQIVKPIRPGQVYSPSSNAVVRPGVGSPAAGQQ